MSLADQARAAASARANFGLDATDAGYVEDGSFWKLRELAVTMLAPRSWTGRSGLGSLSLTVAIPRTPFKVSSASAKPEREPAGKSTWVGSPVTTMREASPSRVKNIFI